MAQGNKNIQPTQPPVPILPAALDALNQAFVNIISRIDAIEGAFASEIGDSDSDTTESRSDVASGRFSVPHSRAPSLWPSRIRGGFNTRTLLCVTAVEGDKSFGLVMARQDLSGVNPGHHSPPTVSVRKPEFYDVLPKI